MPKAQLPFAAVNEWAKAELLGMVMSPPCLGVMAVMDSLSMPYELTKVELPFNKKALRRSAEYKKIPILFLDDIQINDSLIIVRCLGALAGQHLSAEDVAVLELINTDLMVAMEKELFCHAEKPVQQAFVEAYMPNAWAVTKMFTAPVIRYFGGKIAKQRPTLSFKTTLMDVAERRQGAFYNGATPGIVDTYLFGLLHWIGFAEMKFLDQYLAPCRLADWYESMAGQSDGFVRSIVAHL